MFTVSARRVVVRATLSSVAVLVCAACAPSVSSRLSWGALPEGQDILVVAENHIWNDVVIYSEVLGSRTRLGMVVTGQSRRFRIPVHQRSASSLELIADPIGSTRTFRSGPVVVAPGQEIRWRIHRNAAVRNVTIR